jgi:ABC-type sugar transport system permease subunit
MKKIESYNQTAGIGNYAKFAPLLFLGPFILLNGLFQLYPLVQAIPLAFYQTNGPRSSLFVGMENFTFILKDPLFYRALLNTTIYTMGSLLIQLPLSLGLALLLNEGKGKLKEFIRLVLFSPQLTGPVFVAVLFSVMFVPRYGLFNRLVQALIGWGLEKNFLVEPALVVPALIIVTLWMYVGFNMIYFLAALQSIDRSLVEAAQLDGANKWQVFLNVTLPSIKPVLVFVVLMSFVGSFKVFELPYTMLKGYGPKNSGLTIVGYLYRSAFDNGDLGMGAAIGWVLTAIILTMSLLQLRITQGTKDN